MAIHCRAVKNSLRGTVWRSGRVLECKSEDTGSRPGDVTFQTIHFCRRSSTFEKFSWKSSIFIVKFSSGMLETFFDTCVNWSCVTCVELLRQLFLQCTLKFTPRVQNHSWTGMLSVVPCPLPLEYQVASSQARLKSCWALPPWGRSWVEVPILETSPSADFEQQKFMSVQETRRAGTGDQLFSSKRNRDDALKLWRINHTILERKMKRKKKCRQYQRETRYWKGEWTYVSASREERELEELKGRCYSRTERDLIEINGVW